MCHWLFRVVSCRRPSSSANSFFLLKRSTWATNWWMMSWRTLPLVLRTRHPLRPSNNPLPRSFLPYTRHTRTCSKMSFSQCAPWQRRLDKQIENESKESSFFMEYYLLESLRDPFLPLEQIMEWKQKGYKFSKRCDSAGRYPIHLAACGHPRNL